MEDIESVVSQRLVEGALAGDQKAVCEALSNKIVDVNYLGTVNLWVKCTNSVQHEEAPDELKIDYELFKTDITPLFAAAHAGQVDIVRRLLTAGADVNQRLFRGYATTAAAREGRFDVLALLLRAGASQPACEDALLEACLLGQVKAAELLIGSEMTRPEVSANALVYASSCGLVDIVATLVKSGVDVNSWHRVLLRSAKPALHSSVDCTPVIAAIVGRHASVVKYLLDAGAKTDCKARLGAWSWDSSSGDVLRVGAGMAEPYNEAWCAIEYWEENGTILRMLLEHLSPNSEHLGRSLICHAVLCRNVAAAEALLEAKGNVEFCVCTKDGQQFRPLHLAARMGFLPILKTLISYGCELNVKTEAGETALMLCAIHGHQECFQELLLAGADFGVPNNAGLSVVGIAEASNCSVFVHQMILDAILSGQRLYTSNLEVFSPLHFVAHHGDDKVLLKLLEQKDVDINAQDKFGYSAVMVAAQGHIEVFNALVFAGADISLKSQKGETVISLAEASGNQDHCERVLLDAILANAIKGEDFRALHFTAKKGNLEALAHLLKQGCAVNGLDEEGYTPLMLSAREGHADTCKLLLLGGADCHFVNLKGETALALARKSSSAKVAGVILDHVARTFAFEGDQLLKHTRQGKGSPHMKYIHMLKSGMLTWGKSSRQNVLCREAGLGPSPTFKKNRRKDDSGRAGIFRIVTISGREIHFQAAVVSHAELWVRGINLIIKEAKGGTTPVHG